MPDTVQQQESLAQEVAAQQAALEMEDLEEATYANQLALEREQEYNTATAIQKEGLSFGKASLFKYALILLIFAIPNDIIDAVDVSGIGMVISWFISFFLSISTILLVWFTDSELKRVKGHMSKIEDHKKTLTKTATKVAAKLSKYAPKNPLMKVLVGTILEMVPIISILPWSSICVGLAYMDERRAFKEARENSASLTTTSPQRAEVV